MFTVVRKLVKLLDLLGRLDTKSFSINLTIKPQGVSKNMRIKRQLESRFWFLKLNACGRKVKTRGCPSDELFLKIDILSWQFCWLKFVLNISVNFEVTKMVYQTLKISRSGVFDIRCSSCNIGILSRHWILMFIGTPCMLAIAGQNWLMFFMKPMCIGWPWVM